MKFPSLHKCPKGHNKEYYHPTLGPEWCLWCPTCHSIYRDCQNYFRWPLLARLDNFVQDWLTVHAWTNHILRFGLWCGVLKWNKINYKLEWFFQHD